MSEIRVGSMVKLKRHVSGPTHVDARVLGIHSIEGHPDARQYLIEIEGYGLRVVTGDDIERMQSASG